MRYYLLFVLTLFIVNVFRSAVAAQVADLDANDPSLILVMGATGSGKSTFINLASGSNLRVGDSLESCTNQVQVASTFKLDGRSITLIDTPGFDDTTKSDTEILQMVSGFLAMTYQHGKKLTGVIYIHRITDHKMTGVSSRNFKMFRELCGDDTLKNVVILTNMWGDLQNQEIGEARERELRSRDIFFKPALDKGAALLRHNHTTQSAHNVIRHVMARNPVTLQIQREIVVEGKSLGDTAAGIALNKELLEVIQKHREELIQVQKDMEVAIRNRDEETRKELKTLAENHQREIDKIRNAQRTGGDELMSWIELFGKIVLPLLIL